MGSGRGSKATDAVAGSPTGGAASSPASTADQLARLAGLRDRGVISAGQFEREKAKILAARPVRR